MVFDTNVLLGIHSWPDEEATWLLDGLSRKFGDRIWIPHQVALEFVRNRTVRISSRIKEIESAEKEMNNKIINIKDSILQTFKNIRFKVDDSDFPNVEEPIREWVQFYRSQLSEEAENLKKRLNIDNDLMFEKIEKLYVDKIGTPYSYDQEKQIYSEGQIRYENKVPPGYMDDSSKPEVWRKYGDLVLWFQIIDHVVRTEKEGILLITNDSKEDWILKDGRPNPILIQEFNRKTNGKKILLMNIQNFVEDAIQRKYLRRSKKSQEVSFEAELDVLDQSRKLLVSENQNSLSSILNLNSQLSEFQRNLQASLPRAFLSEQFTLPIFEPIKIPEFTPIRLPDFLQAGRVDSLSRFRDLGGLTMPGLRSIDSGSGLSASASFIREEKAEEDEADPSLTQEPQ